MKFVKWFLLSLLALVVVSVIGVVIVYQHYESNKAEWDQKVTEMCKKDGGVTVYEKVEVSKADYPNLKFTSSGYVILSSEGHKKPDDPFYLTSKTEYLKQWSPEIFRSEHSIIRAKDGKELSRLISYSRRGGDFPDGISHPSSYSCGHEEDNLRIYSSVITIKGE